MQIVKIVRKYMLTLILKTDRNTPPPQKKNLSYCSYCDITVYLPKKHITQTRYQLRGMRHIRNSILLKDKNKANSRFETFFFSPNFPFHICEYCKKISTAYK